MGYLSISLTHLQFPLLMFYSSQCISLSPPWSGQVNNTLKDSNFMRYLLFIGADELYSIKM